MVPHHPTATDICDLCLRGQSIHYEAQQCEQILEEALKVTDLANTLIRQKSTVGFVEQVLSFYSLKYNMKERVTDTCVNFQQLQEIKHTSNTLISFPC